MIKRKGSEKRRRLEFDAVAHQVRVNKERFIQRLTRNTAATPDGHVLWTGEAHNGYGRMNLWIEGHHIKVGVQRVFLILMLGRPIGPHMEAGHATGCPYRHCVKCLSEQHWKDNLAERDRRRALPDPTVPF